MAERDGQRRRRWRREQRLADRALEEERVRVGERALAAAVHALVVERAGGPDPVQVGLRERRVGGDLVQQRADAAADVDDPPGPHDLAQLPPLGAAPVSKARA